MNPQAHVANGEIAVVWVGDEATLKQFYKEKNQIRLEPANVRLKALLSLPILKNSGSSARWLVL